MDSMDSDLLIYCRCKVHFMTEFTQFIDLCVRKCAVSFRFLHKLLLLSEWNDGMHVCRIKDVNSCKVMEERKAVLFIQLIKSIDLNIQ